MTLDPLEQKNECYKCLLKQYKDKIKDQKKFREALMGITGVIKTCDTCGQENAMITYKSDMERAVRASQGQRINSAEWD